MQTPTPTLFVRATTACVVAFFSVSVLAAGQAPPPAGQASTPGSKPATPAPAPVPPPPPPDYVIGPDDVLVIAVYKTPEVSGEVGVRPDGKISIPMINEVQAAGKTPEELRQTLMTMFKSFFNDPNVTVIVKAINSRKVSITGNVSKPGPYPLMGPMTVLQLISMAGGLADFAKSKEIVIIRQGLPTPLKVNYEELKKGKNLKQNIELRPGDTIIVP